MLHFYMWGVNYGCVNSPLEKQIACDRFGLGSQVFEKILDDETHELSLAALLKVPDMQLQQASNWGQ